LKFLQNRNNPDAFEPVPGKAPEAPKAAAPTPSAVPTGPESYTVSVNGKAYDVTVSPGGEVTQVAPAVSSAPATAAAGESLPAPLAGNIFKIKVKPGEAISDGDVVMIMEAMKMETEVRATRAGTVQSILVKEGEAVQVGAPLLMLS
jgi:oxaloacetate decarboxylase alpha subunit